MSTLHPAGARRVSGRPRVPLRREIARLELLRRQGALVALSALCVGSSPLRFGFPLCASAIHSLSLARSRIPFLRLRPSPEKWWHTHSVSFLPSSLRSSLGPWCGPSGLQRFVRAKWERGNTLTQTKTSSAKSAILFHVHTHASPCNADRRPLLCCVCMSVCVRALYDTLFFFSQTYK